MKNSPRRMITSIPRSNNYKFTYPIFSEYLDNGIVELAHAIKYIDYNHYATDSDIYKSSCIFTNARVIPASSNLKLQKVKNKNGIKM